MGGLCSSNADPVPVNNTVIQGTQIPEWVSAGGHDLFDEASQLARTPYTPYSGARVAPFTADENAGFQLSRDSVGGYQPYLDKAAGQLDAATKQWSPDVAQSYMNPYSTQVIDIAARKAKEAYDTEKMGRNARAVQTGAYGGDRQAILDSQGEKNYGQTIGDIYTTGLSNAYDRAGQMFAADRNAALAGAQGYGSVAGAQQQLASNDVSNLLATGGMQRQMGQLSLDTAHNDFLDQRKDPYDKINFASGVLSGAPYDKTTSSTTTGSQLVQSPPVLGQLAGAGLAVGAAGKMFNWW